MADTQLGHAARGQLSLLRVGLVSVGDVLAWANGELSSAFDNAALIALTEADGRRAETESALESLVEACGVDVPAPADSVADAVVAVARAMSLGEMALINGARLMWTNLLPLDPTNQHLLEISGAISEWDDDADNRVGYEQDITDSVEEILREAG